MINMIANIYLEGDKAVGGWQCFHLIEEESDVKCTNAKMLEQKNSNIKKHINDGFASPGSMGMTSCEFMQWARINGYA